MAALLAGLGGLTATAGQILNYNKANYLYDRGQMLTRAYQAITLRNQQFQQYREDIRDLSGLTTDKMNQFHTVGTLEMALCVTLIGPARLPANTPEFLLASTILNVACAIAYLLLAMWLSMHAGVSSHSFATRLLTMFVRLPIAKNADLDAATTQAEAFEHDELGTIFRVPYLKAAFKKIWETVDEDTSAPSASTSKFGTTKFGPAASTAKMTQSFAQPPLSPTGRSRPKLNYFSGELRPSPPRRGATNGGLETPPMSPRQKTFAFSQPTQTKFFMESTAPQERSNLPEHKAVHAQMHDLDVNDVEPKDYTHVKLYRQLQQNWLGYDAYCRVTMSAGTYCLLHALCYYATAYFVHTCKSPVTGFVILVMFCIACMSMVHLDMMLPRREFRKAMIYYSTGPVWAWLTLVILDSAGDRENFNVAEVDAASEGILSAAHITTIRHVFSRLTWIPFYFEYKWASWLYNECRSEEIEENDGVALPFAFRSIMYLDVFGTLCRQMQQIPEGVMEEGDETADFHAVGTAQSRNNSMTRPRRQSAGTLEVPNQPVQLAKQRTNRQQERERQLAQRRKECLQALHAAVTARRTGVASLEKCKKLLETATQLAHATQIPQSETTFQLAKMFLEETLAEEMSTKVEKDLQSWKLVDVQQHFPQSVLTQVDELSDTFKEAQRRLRHGISLTRIGLDGKAVYTQKSSDQKLTAEIGGGLNGAPVIKLTSPSPQVSRQKGPDNVVIPVELKQVVAKLSGETPPGTPPQTPGAPPVEDERGEESRRRRASVDVWQPATPVLAPRPASGEAATPPSDKSTGHTESERTLAQQISDAGLTPLWVEVPYDTDGYGTMGTYWVGGPNNEIRWTKPEECGNKAGNLTPTQAKAEAPARRSLITTASQAAGKSGTELKMTPRTQIKKGVPVIRTAGMAAPRKPAVSSTPETVKADPSKSSAAQDGVTSLVTLQQRVREFESLVNKLELVRASLSDALNVSAAIVEKQETGAEPLRAAQRKMSGKHLEGSQSTKITRFALVPPELKTASMEAAEGFKLDALPEVHQARQKQLTPQEAMEQHQQQMEKQQGAVEAMRARGGTQAGATEVLYHERKETMNTAHKADAPSAGAENTDGGPAQEPHKRLWYQPSPAERSISFQDGSRYLFRRKAPSADKSASKAADKSVDKSQTPTSSRASKRPPPLQIPGEEAPKTRARSGSQDSFNANRSRRRSFAERRQSFADAVGSVGAKMQTGGAAMGQALKTLPRLRLSSGGSSHPHKRVSMIPETPVGCKSSKSNKQNPDEDPAIDPLGQSFNGSQGSLSRRLAAHAVTGLLGRQALTNPTNNGKKNQEMLEDTNMTYQDAHDVELEMQKLRQAAGVLPWLSFKWTSETLIWLWRIAGLWHVIKAFFGREFIVVVGGANDASPDPIWRPARMLLDGGTFVAMHDDDDSRGRALLADASHGHSIKASPTMASSTMQQLALAPSELFDYYEPTMLAAVLDVLVLSDGERIRVFSRGQREALAECSTAQHARLDHSGRAYQETGESWEIPCIPRAKSPFFGGAAPTVRGMNTVSVQGPHELAISDADAKSVATLRTKFRVAEAAVCPVTADVYARSEEGDVWRLAKAGGKSRLFSDRAGALAIGEDGTLYVLDDEGSLFYTPPRAS